MLLAPWNRATAGRRAQLAPSAPAGGFSQEAFAEVMGVHRTYFSLVERDERNLTLQTLQRIAYFLRGGSEIPARRVGPESTLAFCATNKPCSDISCGSQRCGLDVQRRHSNRVAQGVERAGAHGTTGKSRSRDRSSQDPTFGYSRRAVRQLVFARPRVHDSVTSR